MINGTPVFQRPLFLAGLCDTLTAEYRRGVPNVCSSSPRLCLTIGRLRAIVVGTDRCEKCRPQHRRYEVLLADCPSDRAGSNTLWATLELAKLIVVLLRIKKSAVDTFDHQGSGLAQKSSRRCWATWGLLE